MSVKSDSGDNQTTSSRPRLCHLRKWSYFQGYGFNLHAEKTRNGQFIGKVDANSPAEAAGLKEKDRIIEVNYVNISNENHQQVVKRIRNGLEIDGRIIENEVVLLVVDEEADNYYKKLNQVIKNNMDGVLYLETPPEDSNTTNTNTNTNNTSAKSNSPAPVRFESTNSTDSSSNQKVSEMQYENVDSNNNNQATNSQNNTRASSNASTPASNAKFNANHYENNKPSPPNTPLSTKSNNSSATTSNTKVAATSVIPPSPTITTTSNHSNNKSLNSSSNNNNNSNDTSGDIFKMSASEFKNYLKNKQKVDPRTEPVDMKQKYQLFQNM